MKKKIKVLIIDDSAIVRQTLTEILSSDPDIEVMGTASDPYVAAKKMREEAPDVITLDVEMPRMDGVTFLQKIMNQHPIPVVICSSLAVNRSETTIKVMEYGAVEIIQKPTLGRVRVGHGLQRGKGFGGHDEQRFGGIEVVCGLDHMGAVDVGDKTQGQVSVRIGLESLIGHHRPQIRSSDPDVYHVTDPLARETGPGAVSYGFSEGGHLVQHGVHIRDYIMTVHEHRTVAGCAQGRMQDSAVLGAVDPLSGEHGFNGVGQSGFFGQGDQ